MYNTCIAYINISNQKVRTETAKPTYFILDDITHVPPVGRIKVTMEICIKIKYLYNIYTFIQYIWAYIISIHVYTILRIHENIT